MQPKVYATLTEIETTLEKMGIPLILLQEAVKAGYISRISRTANDAPNAAGFYQWNDTLRALRENLTKEGWSKDNTGNWPRAIHPERKFFIAVSSGNIATGNQSSTLSTKSAKGPKTANAVDINATQPWIVGFQELCAPLEKTATNDSLPTWFLLFYTDEEEVRAELSLPVGMDCEGHVDEWRERIILPALLTNTSIDLPEPDFGPDIDIQITRRN